MEVEEKGSRDITVMTIRQIPYLQPALVGEIPPSIAAWNLGAGESAVLTWANKHPGTLAMLDDKMGRRCAESLEIPVLGTAGLVLAAKRKNRAGIRASLSQGRRCWQRDLPALTKPGRALEGLAFHSQEQLEAWALYEPGAVRGEPWQIFLTGSAPGPLGRLGFLTVMDLLASLAGDSPLVLARVAPDEIELELLGGAGFEPGGETLLYYQ